MKAMGALPLVSVVIPAYNAEAFLAAALESALSQEGANLDVIVVDDGSTDGTAAVLGRFGEQVRVFRQDNAGSGAARNRGAARARGDYLAFLDADDLWAPGKLSRQLAALAREPTLDMVWGGVREFRDGDDPAASDLPVLAAPHPGAALLRREAFERTGGFSETFRQTEVVEWATRILQAGLRQAGMDDVVMYRRLHGANKGQGNAPARSEYLAVLKRHLDRRRS